MRINRTDTIKRILSETVEEVIDRAVLDKKLLSGKKLVVKLGADPSSPDLHLGHALVLRKLRDFQSLGHDIVFIIGDFTAMIGDPTGRSKTRPALTPDTISKNAETYFTQVGKILDVKKAKIVYNSSWLSKLKLSEFIKAAGQFSLARIVEREDFEKRMTSGEEVGLHEALYQVLQAYDSVAVSADVELGGRDQRVNLLAGRELQRKMGYAPQDIITTPLLVGTDGKRKMSKSLGNYISLSDTAAEIFGKVMSIPDDIILHYAEYAAFMSGEELTGIKTAVKNKPYYAKQDVALKITKTYWGKEKADEAKEVFFAKFVKKGIPESAYEPKKIKRPNKLIELVIYLGAANSNAEARRLIVGKAVEVNGKVYADPNENINLIGGERVRIGKKTFVKLTGFIR